MPACEACGAESEWRSGFKDGPVVESGPRRTRFLCGRYRYEWFGLPLDNLYSGGNRFTHSRWQEFFDRFITEVRFGGKNEQR